MSSIHSAAESTVRALSHAGYEMKKLSIFGKGHHSEESARGFYTVGDRVKSWGTLAASGGHLEPAGWAGSFPHPARGLVTVAGPLGLALGVCAAEPRFEGNARCAESRKAIN